MKVTLILACAGKGSRVGYDKNKLLVKINGKTCLERTLKVFTDSKLIDRYVLTSSPEDFEEISALVGGFATVVLGGSTRTESIRNALREIEDGIVLIHDGARPFVDRRIIADCIESVKNFGSAVTAYPSRDTVIRAEDGIILDYLGKNDLYTVQTPQAFFASDIKKAYELAGERIFNDDGEVYMQYIKPPHVVNGSSDNVKITFRDDMSLLDSARDCRFGVGFDSHRLVDGRKLILGGVQIPHDKGLLGHSDADVLTHAIMDAILSALAMRDIGYHFSDKDPKYKDADSMKLLEQVLLMTEKSGYKVKSVSATIMAEKPKLLNHIPTITENLAKALSLTPDCVGLAATTLEGLGFVGREEGICVQGAAVVAKI